MTQISERLPGMRINNTKNFTPNALIKPSSSYKHNTHPTATRCPLLQVNAFDWQLIKLINLHITLHTLKEKGPINHKTGSKFAFIAPKICS